MGTYFATSSAMKFCLPLVVVLSGCLLNNEHDVGLLPDNYKVGPAAGAECTENSDCGPDQICFNLVCVGDGSLRFRSPSKPIAISICT
jgi:hypothetical protein